MNETITRFEVGRVYRTQFASDSDSKLDYEITKRTAKSVWVRDIYGPRDISKDGRKSVKVYHGSETVRLGNYSMAPILGADRPLIREGGAR